MFHSPRQIPPFLASFALLVGCTSTDPEGTLTGTAVLSLRSTMESRVFELRDATFSITGPSELSLSSEQAPEALVLEQELGVGDYDMQLQDGWQLYEIVDTESVAVSGALSSDNPVSFSISANTTTPIVYRFSVADDELAFDIGELQLAIEVVPEQAGNVIFNEVMNDPVALPDAEGEWIELLNPSDAPFDLEGCSLTRNTTTFSIGSGTSAAR